MFVLNEEQEEVPCEQGVSRKVLAYSDELMMCEITFEKGAKGNAHSHKHLQVTYIAEGRFEFTVNDESRIVKQGDSVYMPSEVIHHVLCLEKGKLVDVFNPKRDEFIR